MKTISILQLLLLCISLISATAAPENSTDNAAVVGNDEENTQTQHHKRQRSRSSSSQSISSNENGSHVRHHRQEQEHRSEERRSHVSSNGERQYRHHRSSTSSSSRRVSRSKVEGSSDEDNAANGETTDTSNNASNKAETNTRNAKNAEMVKSTSKASKAEKKKTAKKIKRGEKKADQIQEIIVHEHGRSKKNMDKRENRRNSESKKMSKKTGRISKKEARKMKKSGKNDEKNGAAINKGKKPKIKSKKKRSGCKHCNISLHLHSDQKLPLFKKLRTKTNFVTTTVFPTSSFYHRKKKQRQSKYLHNQIANKLFQKELEVLSSMLQQQIPVRTRGYRKSYYNPALEHIVRVHSSFHTSYKYKIKQLKQRRNFLLQQKKMLRSSLLVNERQLAKITAELHSIKMHQAKLREEARQQDQAWLVAQKLIQKRKHFKKVQKLRKRMQVEKEAELLSNELLKGVLAKEKAKQKLLTKIRKLKEKKEKALALSLLQLRQMEAEKLKAKVVPATVVTTFTLQPTQITTTNTKLKKTTLKNQMATETEYITSNAASILMPTKSAAVTAKATETEYITERPQSFLKQKNNGKAQSSDDQSESFSSSSSSLGFHSGAHHKRRMQETIWNNSEVMNMLLEYARHSQLPNVDEERARSMAKYIASGLEESGEDPQSWIQRHSGNNGA